MSQATASDRASTDVEAAEPESEKIGDDNINRVPESSEGAEGDSVDVKETSPAWDWTTDPHNPYNWPGGKKAGIVLMISSIALLTYVWTLPNHPSE